MPEELGFGSDAPLSIMGLLSSLGVGVVLAMLLRAHFLRFGSTLSNREEFSQVFPFILLTTILIISVVKSSLALSLGLVGALSIVRFRTPIKEPEELAYLFLAIAMGLGLGAGQILPTTIAGPSILAVMALFKWSRMGHDARNLYLSIEVPSPEGDGALDALNEVVEGHARESDLRRFDLHEGTAEFVYFVDLEDSESLSQLAAAVRERFPSAGLTFLDQNRMPSV
jgi:hypothetical protein